MYTFTCAITSYVQASLNPKLLHLDGVCTNSRSRER